MGNHIAEYKQQAENSAIIAASYEAKALGINRGGMTAHEAKKIYPEVKIFQIEERYGKAYLRLYREGSDAVHNTFMKFTDFIERASIDESYLDITDLAVKRLELFTASAHKFIPEREAEIDEFAQTCFLTDKTNMDKEFYKNRFPSLSYEEKILVMGSEIVWHIRKAVFDGPNYSLSAGVADSKTFSKLICSDNKPGKQTLLLNSHKKEYLANVPLNKVRSLGGKLGRTVRERLNLEMIGDINNSTMTSDFLISMFGEREGQSIYDLSRGICHEEVQKRYYKDSIGSGRNFQGPEQLFTLRTLLDFMKV